MTLSKTYGTEQETVIVKMKKGNLQVNPEARIVSICGDDRDLNARLRHGKLERLGPAGS